MPSLGIDLVCRLAKLAHFKHSIVLELAAEMGRDSLSNIQTSPNVTHPDRGKVSILKHFSSF
jgi:hypothetical protein